MSDSDPGRTLNRKLALLDDLRQAERRAVSARVAAVLAHLIGTPLHVIAGRASLIRSAPSDPSVVENARRIEDQVERLAGRIRGLIDYLTAPDSTVTEESAGEVLAAALSLYTPIGTERGVEIRLVSETDVGPTVDGTSALIVLTSLLSLATRIVTPGASCELSVGIASERQVSFELTVPGLAQPTSRLDTLEPPDHPVNGHYEELQVLSVCSAIARRGGGSIEVVKNDAGVATVRYLASRLS